jgi:dipeptidyl aminopeptidase/acylaminoacyl peptidase
MGAAREPDLYRCAAGYVGVYDLETMHRGNSRTARWLRNWTDDWVGERDKLDERSPVLMAGRIKVPVFLAAGGQDRTAPIAHSKKMERALRSAGKSVETLYFSSEGHGLYTEEHKREYYTRLLDFLSRHLGGAKVASASADQGSKGRSGKEPEAPFMKAPAVQLRLAQQLRPGPPGMQCRPGEST